MSLLVLVEGLDDDEYERRAAWIYLVNLYRRIVEETLVQKLFFG